MATGDTTAPTFGEHLRALLHERGISLRELSRRTNYDPGYLSNIANGHRRPSAPMAKAADQALNANGELAALRPPPRPRTRPKRKPEPPIASDAPTASTVDQGPVRNTWDDDVIRRTFLQLSAALGAGAAIPPGALEHVLSGIEEALGSPLDVEQWERTVYEYGFLINRQPVGSLITDLAADVITVGELLKRGHEASNEAALLRVSAGLSALLAIEFGDIGNRRAARLAWGTARRAADQSGDQALRVWIRAREAEEGFWLELPPSRIDALTKEAVEIANDAPSAGLPRAYAVRASLAAEYGNTATARAVMDKLSNVFEGLPTTVIDDPGTFGWNEARYRWNQAYVYTLIKDSRAQQAVSTALDLYPPGTLGPVANLHVIQAMGMINEREISTGLDQTLTTLHDLPVSPARHRMAGQILTALPDTARVLPAARELRILTTAPA